MSYGYDMDNGYAGMPERWIATIGYNKYIFHEKKDAESFIRAAEKMMGEKNYTTFHKEGEPEHLGFQDSIEVQEISLESYRIGTKTEVRNNSCWSPVLKCDGVPRADGGNCGCWHKLYATHECPDDWQEYYDGIAKEKRHICPECQGKEIKVSFQRVETCEIPS